MSGYQTNAGAVFLPPGINNNVVLRQSSVGNVDPAALNAYHQHLYPWQIQNLYRNAYDPLWMQAYGINPVVLNAFFSKQKMEHLVLHGVLLPGDVLLAPNAQDHTGLVERSAECFLAQLATGCGGGKVYPDFAILVRDHSGYSGLDVEDCHGTTEIVQAWNTIHRIGGVTTSAAWRQMRQRNIHIEGHEDTMATFFLPILKASHSTFTLDERYIRVKDRAAMNSYHGHLSEQQLQNLADEPYDDKWMDKLNLDKAVLKTFIAKHKLEYLVARGALNVEDELRYDETSPVWFMKTGLITKASGPGKTFPDLAIRSSNLDEKTTVEQDLPDCNGPRDLMRTFNTMAPQANASTTRAWQAVWVIANDRMTDGRLHDFRQRFAYYEMLVKG
ncbi:MAG: hypothetical protein Q9174_005102 [Haloplaca sp. 1 TL-2023]